MGWHELVVGLGFGAITMALLYPTRDGLIARRRGAMLLALYVVYVTTLWTH